MIEYKQCESIMIIFILYKENHRHQICKQKILNTIKKKIV